MNDFDLMSIANWGNQSTGQNYLPLAPFQGSPAPQISGNAPMDWLNQLQTTPLAGGVVGGATNPGFFSLDSFFGKNGQQGWGNTALGAAQGIGGLLMGMKQYGLAKDALAQSQNQFTKNYEAQKQTLNTQLEDRQRARVAASGGVGNVESVESYLERNRIR